MRFSTWTIDVAVALLAITATALYATRLSVAPIYLFHDEVKFSLQAQAIAATAHDLNGRLMPLYFSEPDFEAGRDPVMIYVTALGLQVMPFHRRPCGCPPRWWAC